MRFERNPLEWVERQGGLDVTRTLVAHAHVDHVCTVDGGYGPRSRGRSRAVLANEFGDPLLTDQETATSVSNR
jgi:hypothetical protein